MSTVARVLLAIGLVLGGFGCAKQDWIDRTLVTVDVTGTWDGTMSAPGGAGGGGVRFDLEQKGPIVTGQYRMVGRQSGGHLSPGTIEGSVAGDTFTFKDKRGNLSGELTVNGDEMEGSASSVAKFKVSLRRVDPSSPPASPPR